MLQFLDKTKLDMIRNAKPEEMSELILAVQQRYGECFPEWELDFICFERSVDKNEQLERAIEILENRKDH